jgi:hypothetical protein
MCPFAPLGGAHRGDEFRLRPAPHNWKESMSVTSVKLTKNETSERPRAADERPGCFGSPMVFKKTHPVCRQCEFAGSCELLSNARREALWDKHGIPPKPVRVRQAKRTRRSIEAATPPR